MTLYNRRENEGNGGGGQLWRKGRLGKGSVGRKLDFVEEVGAEGSDEVVGVLAEVGVFGEKVDEIPN